MTDTHANKLVQNRMLSRRPTDRSLFPYPAASSELLMHIDEFLSATPRDHALTRVLTERRDTVQRALRSRALPR